MLVFMLVHVSSELSAQTIESRWQGKVTGFTFRPKEISELDAEGERSRTEGIVLSLDSPCNEGNLESK